MSFCCTGGRAERAPSLRGLLAVTGIAAMLAVGSAGTARAATVSPTVHAGNVNSCSDIVRGAYGANVDGRAGSGTFDDGTLSGTYTISDDGTTFDWASGSIPVSFVVVKGGTDANVYRYAGAMSDGGLVSPLNRGGQLPTISHVLVCYGEQPPPPPATGRIVIEKKTAPAGADQEFTFHPSENLSSSDFLLADGGEKVFDTAAGTYAVEELPTQGWTLSKLSCDDADSSTDGATASIDLAAGETVTCTFTNTKDAVDNPPVDNPPVDNPPGNPITTPPVSLPPAATATAPAAGTAPAAPSQAVKGTRVARGTASLRLRGCATRRARVTVSGSRMRRIVFSVNGRRVKTVAVRAGRRSVTVSLPVGAVSARITFRNGAPARTLRARARRCAAQTVRPQFTG
jgi:hypothetical protein